MNSLNAFAYDVNDFLKTVSKKSTESDITLHNRKGKSGTAIIFSEPDCFALDRAS